MIPEAQETYVGRTPEGVLFVLGSPGYWDGRHFELQPNGWGTEVHLVGNNHDELVATYQSYASARAAYRIASSNDTLEQALSTMERIEIEHHVKPSDWCVYVLHFDQKVGKPWTPIERALLGKRSLPPRQKPYKPHAGHYVGCTNEIERRMAEHKAGNGRSTPLVRALLNQGGSFQVAQLYVFDNEHDAKLEEARIKSWKNTPKLCEICKEIDDV